MPLAEQAMLSYIEFCAGGGGTRAGLAAAGWNCILSMDNDPDAVAVHRLAHGDAELADVTQISSTDLPDADVWVAGFPCQPFSSSGSRQGFLHRSGNVFERLCELIADRLPKLLILENVEGLLTNKGGHTMVSILSRLEKYGYEVSWCLMNLNWFGVPQSRPRIFFVAAQKGLLCQPLLATDGDMLLQSDGKRPNAFAALLHDHRIGCSMRCNGSLAATEERLRPAIGKAQESGKYVFGPLGSTESGQFFSYNITVTQKLHPSRLELASLVAPNFEHSDGVRSIRFWTTDSGRGPTKMHVRSEPTSHCIGTSLGGAPLYAVPLNRVLKPADRAAFLEFANWHREQDGLLVMRLRPHRAVKLFGPHTDPIFQALTEWNAGDTRKYKVLGNMVAPVCAKAVAELVNKQLAAPKQKTNGEASARLGNRKGKAPSAKPVAR